MARVVQPNILPEIQGVPIQDFPSNEEVLKEWHGTSVPTETNIGSAEAISSWSGDLGPWSPVYLISGAPVCNDDIPVLSIAIIFLC